MKAGRELDALIAEKVMGWADIKTGHYRAYEDELLGCRPDQKEGTVSHIPPYSTDIAAAWEVVEHFRGWQVNIGTLREPARDDWHGWWVSLSGPIKINICGITAPHAICLAALKAMGVDLAG